MANLARQPGVEGVVEVEPRLHAGKVRRTFTEGSDRLAQLIRFRPVLGVVNSEVVAARQRQRVVERFRLGAGMKVRHHHDLDRAGEIERLSRGDGLAIDRLQD
jgi:hypothetical protein